MHGGYMSAPPNRKKSQKETYEEDYNASKQGGESFFPQVVLKDAIIAFLLVAVIIVLAVIVPASSQLPADPTSTTYIPRPEWYFLFFFEFLKLFPGSLEAVAAVIIPVLALIILFWVPFLETGLERRWSKRKRPIAIGAAVLIFLGTLEVMGALSAAPSQPQESPLVQEGLMVYQQINCAYCHSINGVGGAIGPDLSNVASQLTKEQITSYLQNPDLMVANTLHPKLEFTPDELNKLVAYLETLGPPVVYSPQAPQFFAQNCAVCHSVNGVGGALGPDLSREGSLRTIDFLQSFISDPTTVVQGATMPAFNRVLTPDQIKDIAAYLSSLKGQIASPTSTPAELTPTPTSTSTATINPSQLYSANCAICHGANREGGTGPAVTEAALANWSISQITDFINEGGEGGMPSFSEKMSPEQISSLANFLKNEPP